MKTSGHTASRAMAIGCVAAGLLTSCAHESAAAKPSAHPAPQPASASAQPGAAVEELAAERDESPDELDEFGAAPVRIEDFMNSHFVIITWARDAVINGSLEALREPLYTMADFDYKPVAPGGWMEKIAAIQATARITAEAESLAMAAAGVATMARQCGDCHTAERHKPYFGPDIRARRPVEPGSLQERMERHIWATDRMWEGLTAPSEDAWNAGAAALANLPVDKAAARLPEEYVAQLRTLRELGAAAVHADTRADRANVFGAMLASCATCHADEDELTK